MDCGGGGSGGGGPILTFSGGVIMSAWGWVSTVVQFMEMYRNGDFSHDMVRRESLTYSKIFEEVPVTVKSSSLARMLLTELEADVPTDGVRHLSRHVTRAGPPGWWWLWWSQCITRIPPPILTSHLRVTRSLIVWTCRQTATWRRTFGLS